MSLTVDIRKNLGAFTVDAGFEAGNGITTLFGKSGAGKTSIVQMLSGLMTPDTGKIVLNGKTLFDSASRLQVPAQDRQIGYVFQDARLFPHMNVRRNLEYGTRRRKKQGTDTPKFDDVIAVLGIEQLLDRQTHQLSGGERQRVAIGRALLSSPRLLLMDEPLAALDAERKWEIIPFIQSTQREFGIPAIYVSHAVEEVLQLADKMVLLVDGGVAASGPVEDVMNRPDLIRVTGAGDPGTVIPVWVKDEGVDAGIARLSFAGGEFRVVATGLEKGTRLRLRVRARDVSLATSRPKNVSVLNVFEGRVTSVSDDDRPQAEVSIDVGGATIWSQITRRSLHELEIEPGSNVFAMVKAVAIDRPAIRT